ncbi:Ribosomal protein L18e/L15P [Phytophthora cactorum]|nr:Ribosomal protein L18e/L15P [Phytophthora cactorum]
MLRTKRREHARVTVTHLVPSNIGSDNGKTSGHGHLGQKVLSGGSPGRGPGFGGDREPGQAAALRGHGPPRHQQQDHHKELVDPGLVTCSRVKYGIKLLGNGSQHLTAKMDIEVSQVSESAFKPWRRPVAVSRQCTTTDWHCVRCASAEVRDAPAAGASESQESHVLHQLWLSPEIQVKRRSPRLATRNRRVRWKEEDRSKERCDAYAER